MGRQNRDRWTFYSHPSKRVLDGNEVRYWKQSLSKITKIGLEFEFNLPDKTGDCRGDSPICPCESFPDKNCWTKCLNKSTCVIVNQDKECYGILCTNFSSQCLTCSDFKRRCTDCEYKYDQNKHPDAIRQAIIDELAPNMNYGMVSKSGIHNIVTDNSLKGKSGVEIITVGRRVDYWEFFKMSSNIIAVATKRGAYADERTSIHAHLLAAYYNKLSCSKNLDLDSKNIMISELEKPVPEIILSNFHQLCRRYQNAITWMTSGLSTKDKLTRWEKFRTSVLGISAVTNSMKTVKSMVSGLSVKSKYGWVNYLPCTFDANGDISRLHLEMRVMDCLLSPSAVAALSCLYYAILIKAVEISRYGILEAGDMLWMQHAMEIKEKLLNNVSDWNEVDRFSHTEDLEKYYEDLKYESSDLITQLKHIIASTGPAYDVLEKLAETPCSIMRCEGKSWAEIENILSIKDIARDSLFMKFSEAIDLRLVDKCVNEEEWLNETTDLLKLETTMYDTTVKTLREKLSGYIQDKKSNGEVVWLKKIGTFVNV